MLEAVAAAHAHGVLHRDLKPGNVLLGMHADGPEVKVIDFGMARAIVPDERRITPIGVAHRLGTPEYMAPEQWKDGIATCDARADVFALGMICGEVAAGVLAREPDSGRPDAPRSRARRAPPSPCLPSVAFARLRSVDPVAADVAARARRVRDAGALLSFLERRIDPLVAPMIAVRPGDRPADGASALALLDAMTGT